MNTNIDYFEIKEKDYEIDTLNVKLDKYMGLVSSIENEETNNKN